MRRFWFLISFLLISWSGFSQGYKIEIKVDGMADSTIYLAYHYGNKKFMYDTIIMDHQGKVIVEGEDPLPGGVYLVVMPQMNYFEMLIGENQEFSVETKTGNFLETLKFTGSPENTAFLEYQKFMVDINKKNSELRELLIKYVMKPDSLFIIQDQLDENQKKIEDYLTNLNKNFPGSFMSDLLNAMAQPEIPAFEIPDDVVNRDSVRMVRTYSYLRDHYFDKVNFANEKLIRTPVLQSKLNMYFNRVLVQIPDSITPQIDKIINLASINDEMYQYVVIFALNNFLESKVMGMDAVFVNVAEKYYLSGKTPWVDSTYISKLNERVVRIRPTLIGRKAADLKMETITGEWVSLHQTDAKFTVLYFWEPNCGFCKEAMPKLYELYEKYRDRGVKIFAIDTQDDKKAWEDYVNEHGYDWINAWDPKQESYFRFFYDINSTPVIYLLDENKTIIAKRIDVESLDQMLWQLLGG